MRVLAIERVLKKAEEITPKDFYMKSLKKLGVPFSIFVLIYYIYDVCNERMLSNEIIPSLYKGFVGYYAHWYVVMLAVIYAFIPLIAFIRKRVEYKKYEWAVIIIFIWLMVGHYFEITQTSWSLSNLYFGGYVLMGDVINTRIQKKSNFVGFLLVFFGLFILGCNHLILYNHVINGGEYYNKLLNLYGAPLIIISSLMIFTGFSLLEIKRSVRTIAGASYTVFLSHKLILNVLIDYTSLFQIFEKTLKWNLGIIILIEWLLVLLVSLIISIIFNYVLNKTLYNNK